MSDTLYENFTPVTTNSSASIWGSDKWHGQSFTPSTSHNLTSIKILAFRLNNPGTLTIALKATNGSGEPTGADLVTGTTDGNTLSDDFSLPTLREITISPTALTSGTKYAFIVKALSGDASNNAKLRIVTDADATYAGGTFLQTSDAGVSWDVFTSPNTEEDTYFLEYGISTTPSEVTTQKTITVTSTTATGNGNIIVLGDSPTQYGHVWNTSGNPTTADSKTEKGVPASTGAFTSSVTSLTVGTKYYFKAYVTDGAGTHYGNEVTYGVKVWPTDTLTRVNSVTRTFFSGKGGQYNMELSCGGISSLYVPPIGQKKPVSAVPQEAPAKNAQPQFTYSDYVQWVNKMQPWYLQATYGHIPTFDEWIAIMTSQMIAGQR